jgi:tRNA modification GTPase
VIQKDLIAAIATASGRGGIGVVRVSGEGVAEVVLGVIGHTLKPRVATFTSFKDIGGAVIDQGIALHFVAPFSYTGEDVLELHGHGGPAVLQRLLRRCLGLGCRIARPGEFTERAFLNDKLDLAQAEGVADLVNATSDAASRSAVRTLMGAFSERVNSLCARMVELRMHAEACIDFPEEEIDPLERDALVRGLGNAREQLDDMVSKAKQGAVLRDGLTVVLIGRPNVGKSSLLNQLAGEELAIVTPIAGTTRDAVRATIHLEGVPIHLIDTAGLRLTDDEVEKIGIERTWAAARVAGAAILITEAGEIAGIEEAGILNQLPAGLPIAFVYNKIDLFRTRTVPRETIIGHVDAHHAVFHLSALLGEGVDALRGWLLLTAGWEPTGEGSFLARERHMVALSLASAHLGSAEACIGQFELFAEELRLAHRALATITGEFTPDDLLGEIFSRFCVGK